MLRPSKACTRVFVAAAALVSTAVVARAQTLQLRLVDEETHRPLAGVLVSALGAGGALGPAVLASADGIAVVRVTGNGPYRLLIRRIGFAPVTTAPLALPAEAGRLVDIVVPVHRIVLGTVHVVTNGVCAAQTVSPSTTAQAAWTEVRTALEASTLTREQRLVTTAAIRLKRELNRDGSVLRVDTTRLAALGERPFYAPPPAALERDGYYREHDDGAEDFYAPDEAVLLSDGFTRLHCVSLLATVRRDSTGTELALAFTPRTGDKRPDIRGVIWIDSATSELRRIDFMYVRAKLPASADSLGGSVTFTHLASGAWIVSSWGIRMPRWRIMNLRTKWLALDGYTEVGGTASVVREITTPAPNTPRIIVGSVFDSLAGRPLGGARVHLADAGRETIADSLGAFRFDSVSAGVHTVWADHARLDTLGLFSLGAQVDATPEVMNRVALAIPSFTTLWQRACGTGTVAAQGEGFVFGHVQLPARALRAGAFPGSGPVVTLSWAEARRTAQVDSTGSYAVCGVPVNAMATLSARADSAATIPVWLHIGAERFARRDLTVPSEDAIEQVVRDPSTLALLPAADGASVAGVVRDSTGEPIEGARVTVSGIAHEWRTRADGGFLARGIPAGARVVTVAALGFVPERRLLDVAAHDSAYLALSATRLITTLAAVTVKERDAKNALKSDLEQRRRAGFGYWADSVALQRLPGVKEAFSLPGTWAMDTPGDPETSWRIFMTGIYSMPLTGGAVSTCQPTVWVDGMVSDITYLTQLTKDEIGLIEVYTSAAAAPTQFAGTRTNCGIVLIWRKRFINP
jgi:hypothetical protein